MNQINSTYCVGRFPQLTRRVFTTEQGLKSNIASALCFDKKDNLYVGTNKGLSRLDGDKFVSVDIGKDTDVSMLYCDKENHLFIGAGNKLIELCGKKKISSREFSTKIVDMKIDDDGVSWILTEAVLYRQPKGSDAFDLEIGVPGNGSCIAALRNNKVYVGTAGGGLHALVGKRWHWSELMSDMTGLLSDTVTCLDIDPVGNVWIGTDKGMCVYDDNSYWLDSTKISGLPGASITGMAVAPDGDRYYSTTTGLIHQHNGQFSYYGYKRWLPSPNATAVALAPDGTVCVATDKGISLIETTMMTLEEKAKYFFERTEKYNVRKDGYILGRDLDHEGVLSTEEGFVTNSDNDGMWTGLYVAALSFNYACTKDEEIRKAAARSLKAMIKLTTITGKKGFTARAIRYPDEREYGTGARHEWHIIKDKDGNELEWLGETSSDEMVGHLYAYSCYYDLVANDEEKELICTTVKNILDHILDNNFRLVDVDGIPTTWANWDPDLLNNDHKWIFEKGTNSLEILSFLKIGEHIVGDPRYTEAFNMLAGKKHYAMNAMQYKIPDGHMLHIDDNLCFTVIYPLMKYTEDPILRSIFAMGLTHHWKDERVERNAMFNFTYGALTGERFDVENAVDELVDCPLDTIMWSLYNSYRTDLEWDMHPQELGMIPQLCEPLSAHERRIVNNDCNRFVADSGAEDVAINAFKKKDGPSSTPMFPGTGNDKGMCAMSGTNFLHPYWFARYCGLIKD
jgi:hypothetical protein